MRKLKIKNKINFKIFLIFNAIFWNILGVDIFRPPKKLPRLDWQKKMADLKCREEIFFMILKLLAEKKSPPKLPILQNLEI